jgi:hypothetical protein
MIDASIRAAEMLHVFGNWRRLAIVVELAKNGPAALQTLSERLSMPVKSVVKEVTRLSAVGLVRMEDHQVTPHLDAAEALAHELVADTGLQSRLNESSPLRKFFSWGRLTSIPNDFEIRRELAFLAVTLVPEHGLAESQLNEALGRYYDDHAELRRLMVDFGAATRDNHTLTYYPVRRAPESSS